MKLFNTVQIKRVTRSNYGTRDVRKAVPYTCFIDNTLSSLAVLNADYDGVVVYIREDDVKVGDIVVITHNNTTQEHRIKNITYNKLYYGLVL